jgi:hypothetical protein
MVSIVSKVPDFTVQKFNIRTEFEGSVCLKLPFGTTGTCGTIGTLEDFSPWQNCSTLNLQNYAIADLKLFLVTNRSI